MNLYIVTKSFEPATYFFENHINMELWWKVLQVIRTFWTRNLFFSKITYEMDN